ncbi:hypothetical protein SAMN05216548_10719 [Faunimonas pinastri]|uniref:Methyltransferase n=1 Tax=Faunimonas pinastri TaxID=1855383 RepID=A0A1H9I8N7_9HYPH|nr:hypothetical protein [Faunimonas pinastri]SEQ70927.1 hypothetical protein SAMN05216548_10719 [Faunimonas pinastri]
MNAITRLKDAKVWARDPDDWYVEPEWCSRRLFEVEPFTGTIHDPACGFGRIVEAARDAGHQAFGSDLHHRWPPSHGGYMPADYRQWPPAEAFYGSVWHRGFDNVVSNPPFKFADPRDNKAECFVRMALARTRRKVAMLLPTTWQCGGKRGAWLETTPLFRIWNLGPRPSMPPGTVIQEGAAAGSGTKDFSWFVWLHGFDGAPTVSWLRREANAA